MKTRYFSQPLEDQLGKVLITSLGKIQGSPDAELCIFVAWAKLSGLRLLQPSIAALTGAGGRASIVVGIDQRGTTQEALRRIVDIGCELHVYHDEPSKGAFVGRSFHPKLYICRNREYSRVIIGSGNLTAGGLYNNYEWFSDTTFNLLDATDRKAAARLDTSIGALTADDSTCVAFDSSELDDLFAKYEGLIPTERRAARERTNAAPPKPRERLFGGRLGLPVAPPRLTDLVDREAPFARSGPRPRVTTASGLRRVVQMIGRGRPGQVQLRRPVAEWIFRGRTSAVFEHAQDGARSRRPLVATHARGGGINTVRVELHGFDQNREPALVVLEELPDTSIQWTAIPLDAPAARPYRALLRPRTGHRMPATLQALRRDGQWVTESEI